MEALHLDRINWIGVIGGVIVMQVLGFLWYGPIFGERWMAARGVTREQIQAGGGGSAYLVISAILSLIMVLAFGILLTVPPDVTLVSGVVWGILLSIGFSATSVLISAYFNETSREVAWLFVGYNLIGLAITGAIFGLT
jgi:hypothetical protein